MDREDTHISQVLKGCRLLTDEDAVLPTGIINLDKQIKGFALGDLVTLLAYPGNDKLNLAVRIISFQAIDNNISSAYFCTRETVEIVARRLVCYRGNFLPNRLIDYEITGEPREWKEWVEKIKEKISQSPIYLFPNDKLSTDDICGQCTLYAKSGVKVIYIYLNHNDIKDDIVCKLKAITSRMCVVIILLIDVIGERHGLEKQPCLGDLAFCELDEYSNIVIGFNDCDAFDYVQDDKVSELTGKTRFQVIKDRNNLQHEPFYLNSLGMILKQYSEPSEEKDNNTGEYFPFDT